MIAVRATRDFHAGPRQANGSRDVAIAKGSTREICEPGERGLFYTLTKWGTIFGPCRLGQGWERVHTDRPSAARASPSSLRSHAQPPANVTDAVTVGGLAWAAGAFDSAASDELEGASRAGEDGDGEDDWPL